jgi:predicted Zn finger-like uncharacterized protein
MNQITRCPNCSTSFRVTDDQLSAHQGKVRCGRCAFVFNARDFLQALPAEASKPVIESKGIAPESLPNITPEAIPQEVAAASQIKSEPTAAISTPAASKVVESEAAATEPASDDHELQRALARLAKKARSNKIRRPRRASKRHTVMVTDETEFPSQPETSASAQTAEDDAEYRPILDDDDPLFKPVNQSRYTGVWAFGSVILLLVLFAQLAYNFRLPLSQEFPALRPKMIALCGYLQCDMPLPQEAQLLRSEWSELTYIPDHPTLVQVKATLRNLAAFEQALPKLELTLTDENERVVARKIFTAKQYLAQSEPGQASLLPNDEVHAFLQLDLGQLRSTGYSLYWFYD